MLEMRSYEINGRNIDKFDRKTKLANEIDSHHRTKHGDIIDSLQYLIVQMFAS